MNTDFEPVMAALFAWIQANTAFPITATATAGSPTLTGVSAFTGLFAGLPIFGPGVVKGATIAGLNPGSGEIVLSDPVGAAVTGGAFAAGFQTFGRRVIPWSQVAAQPALFLRRIGTQDSYGHDSALSITTLKCEVWIYCNAGQNPDLAPDIGLTALERLVRESFVIDNADDDDARFTIGGRVYWCRFEGEGTSSPGDLAGQAISLMPVRITLP